MKHNRTIEIIAVVVIAAVLIGEVIVYTSGTNDFRIDASRTGDDADYSLSVRGSQVYSVIGMDNGTVENLDEIYVYYDSRYASDYKSEQGPIGSHEVDQEYYIDQLVKNLAFRSNTPVRILDADELLAAMEEDIASGNTNKGLVVISGALPDTIYADGGPGVDPVFEWLEKGGRLYWAGNVLGALYSTQDGLETVTGDYENWFFGVAPGTDCINKGDDDFAGADVANTLRYDLSLKNNRVKYGLDVEKLPGSDSDKLAMGYTDGTYSSIVFTKYWNGTGSICVVAGDLSRNQWNDFSQILASNVCYATEVVDVHSGSLRYGSVEGRMDLSGKGDVSMYIYLGGYYPVYGRSFWLEP